MGEYEDFEARIFNHVSKSRSLKKSFCQKIGIIFGTSAKNIDVDDKIIQSRIRSIIKPEIIHDLQTTAKNLRNNTDNSDTQIRHAIKFYFFISVDADYHYLSQSINVLLFGQDEENLPISAEKKFDFVLTKQKFNRIMAQYEAVQAGVDDSSMSLSHVEDTPGDKPNRGWVSTITNLFEMQRLLQVIAAIVIVTTTLTATWNLTRSPAPAPAPAPIPKLHERVVKSRTLPGHEEYQRAVEQLRGSDKKAAIDFLTSANSLGHPMAAAEIGIAYGIGEFAEYGLTKDPQFSQMFVDVAVERDIKRLAKDGEPDALYNYGLMLFYGIGVKEDQIAGKQQLELAWARGLKRAAARLSYLDLENSEDRDACVGYELAQIAKDAGHLLAYWTEARYLQDHACPRSMGGKQKALREAVRLLEHSAEKGHAPSQNSLGKAYRENQGIPEDEGNDKEAVHWFEEAAKQGHLEAINNWGAMYTYNRGVPVSDENDTIAVEKFRIAAKRNDARGQRNLGWMYMKKRGVPLDEDTDRKAVEWFEKSADQGYAKAELDLGVMYAKNRGVPPNDKNSDTALMWYAKAAAQGNAQAIVNIGRLYANNKVIAKSRDNDAEAVKWFRKAIKQNFAEAQAQLGWMYMNKRGVSLDEDTDVKAVKWYRKAALQKVAWAQNNLGWMYEMGRVTLGSKDDKAKAVNWYRKAADQGYAQAQTNLGNMYKNNRGVPNLENKDAEAVKWFRRAVEQNFSEAQAQLGWMYMKKRGVSLDEDTDVEAVKWYRKAAHQKVAWAQTNLGWMYANNRGVPQSKDNDTEAVKWYRMAADQDLTRAQIVLAKMYAADRGVPKNKKNDAVAVEWFEKAVGLGDQSARLALAEAFTFGDLSPKYKEVAQRQLTEAIESKEIEFLKELFSDDIWIYYSAGRDVRYECEAGFRYYCFGFDSENLEPYIAEMSDMGIIGASFALVNYYETMSECGKASVYIDRIKNYKNKKENYYRTNIFLFKHYYKTCDVKIPKVKTTEGLFDAAHEGYSLAIRFLSVDPENLDGEFVKRYPGFVAELESSAESLSDSDVWYRLAKIYENGFPGISADLQKSEKYYKATIASGAGYHIDDLAWFYIAHFHPPRFREAINVVRNQSNLQHILNDLTWLLKKSKREIDNEVVHKSIFRAIAEVEDAGRVAWPH